MSQENNVLSSSGNIFADLELANPEELLLKAQLVRQISQLIAKRKLTETEAADIIGIELAKVSALLRGKLSEFSTQRLLRFLNALGSDVEIRVIPKPESEFHGEIRVVTV